MQEQTLALHLLDELRYNLGYLLLLFGYRPLEVGALSPPVTARNNLVRRVAVRSGVGMDLEPQGTVLAGLLQDVADGGVGDEADDGLVRSRVELVHEDDHQVDVGGVVVEVTDVNALDATDGRSLGPPDVELDVAGVDGSLGSVELVVLLKNLLRVETRVDADALHRLPPQLGDFEGRRHGGVVGQRVTGWVAEPGVLAGAGVVGQRGRGSEVVPNRT